MASIYSTRNQRNVLWEEFWILLIGSCQPLPPLTLSAGPGHFGKALLAIRNKRKPAAAMGSYGDRLLNCVECGLEGKCMLDEFLNGAEPLTDCDFAGGPLCHACLYVLTGLAVPPATGPSAPSLTRGLATSPSAATDLALSAPAPLAPASAPAVLSAPAASPAAPAAEATAGERFRKFIDSSALESCRRARLYGRVVGGKRDRRCVFIGSTTHGPRSAPGHRPLSAVIADSGHRLGDTTDRPQAPQRHQLQAAEHHHGRWR